MSKQSDGRRYTFCRQADRERCARSTSRVGRTQADVAADAKISCPLCASTLKAATAKAAEQHITEPAPAKQTRGRKLKAETAEPQLADAVAESDAVVS